MFLIMGNAGFCPSAVPPQPRITEPAIPSKDDFSSGFPAEVRSCGAMGVACCTMKDNVSGSGFPGLRLHRFRFRVQGVRV